MNNTSSKTVRQESGEPAPEDQSEIERSLRRITSYQEASERPWGARRSAVPLLFYAAAMLALGATYVLLDLGIVSMSEVSDPYLKRSILGGLFAVITLVGERLLRNHVIGRLEDEVSRFNLKRLVRFFVFVILALVAVSTFLINWTTAFVSIGVFSIILGLALQDPLSNLFAWFYILMQAPYRIGDRIRIGESSGDVIDLGYFVTALWEFGGDYVSSDHPSGRIIKFPNSLVLSTPVFNYSWPLFPYIWNEIKLYVAYESDLEFSRRR